MWILREPLDRSAARSLVKIHCKDGAFDIFAAGIVQGNSWVFRRRHEGALNSAGELVPSNCDHLIWQLQVVFADTTVDSGWLGGELREFEHTRVATGDRRCPLFDLQFRAMACKVDKICVLVHTMQKKAGEASQGREGWGR